MMLHPARHRTVAHSTVGRCAGLPRRILLSVAAVAAFVVGVATLTVPGAKGAFLAGITNNTNTAGAATYFTCTYAVNGTTPGGTSSSPASFAYPLDDASAAGGARNAVTAGAAGVYSGTGIGFHAAGPCPRDNAYAITLNGTNQYATTPAAVANPAVVSVEIWFRTTTTTGGVLASFAATNGLSHDRTLYLTNSGTLGLVLNAGLLSTPILTSPASYRDGAWHQAVVTLTASATVMYVDGVSVASTTGSTAVNVTGNWRFGYDNPLLWTSAPTSVSLTGNIAWASVYPYALSATQVATHRRAGI